MHEAPSTYSLPLNNFNGIFIMHFVCCVTSQPKATECLLCARNRQRQAIDVTEGADFRSGICVHPPNGETTVQSQTQVLYSVFTYVLNALCGFNETRKRKRLLPYLAVYIVNKLNSISSYYYCSHRDGIAPVLSNPESSDKQDMS